MPGLEEKYRKQHEKHLEFVTLKTKETYNKGGIVFTSIDNLDADKFYKRAFLGENPKFAMVHILSGQGYHINAGEVKRYIPNIEHLSKKPLQPTASAEECGISKHQKILKYFICQLLTGTMAWVDEHKSAIKTVTANTTSATPMDITVTTTAMNICTRTMATTTAMRCATTTLTATCHARMNTTTTTSTNTTARTAATTTTSATTMMGVNCIDWTHNSKTQSRKVMPRPPRIQRPVDAIGHGDEPLYYPAIFDAERNKSGNSKVRPLSLQI